MPTFIGYAYDGKPLSIVVAKTKELAYAYWQGLGLHIHSDKSPENPEDFTPLDEHPTGVYPILKTKEIGVYNLKRDAKLLTVTI